VTVLVNWRLSSTEIEFILEHSEARLTFVEQEFREIVGCALARLGRNFRSIVLDDGSYPQWRNAQNARAHSTSWLPGQEVIQLYTSGTTGHPKGVVLSHRNIVAMINQAIAAGWGNWGHSIRQLICMPMFHVGGLSLALIALAQGATNVIVRDANVSTIASAIAEYRVQKVFLVPAVLRLLNEAEVGCALNSLDLVLYGASPISQSLLLKLKQKFSCRFAQLYGMTELTGAAVYLPPEDHLPERGKLLSCGKPHPGVDVRIVGHSSRNLPAYEIGEVCVKSDSVLKQYWHDLRSTEEAIRDGWLHTGDAGYLDNEGYLFIHDRVKDMIISGGENIYPAEVENAIGAHPSVEEVAVIGVPDECWGESVKAVVVPKVDCSLSLKDLVEFLQGRIASYKMPKSLDLVQELPRTSSGKILKRQVRSKYWIHVGREVNG
jgi:acyl-CoA synthetase (AMP-forming)/AMP-acid ligase II